MKMLLPFLFVVAVVVIAAGVAPGDEDPLCQQLRANGTAPMPHYAANMRVLMDSWNYQNLLPPHTGAVWTEVHADNDDHKSDEFDGAVTRWIQNSNTSCQQSVEVCGFDPFHDNLLISQLINRTVDGIHLSRVYISVEFQQCDCNRCDTRFNIHVYETSSPDTTGARNVSNYQLVGNASSDTNVGSGDRDYLNVTVNFNTNHSSFYFSIEDMSCLLLTRVIVFYKVCPSQIRNMIIYPETISPSNGTRMTTGSCIDNAEPVINGSFPKLGCSSSGNWSVIDGQCRCRPGAVSTRGKCIICPTGRYLSPSTKSCSACPNNSVSNSPGLTQCTCIDGYYRAMTGEEDLPCTLPPSPPTNLRVVAKTDDSISITWEPPLENPGDRGISYNVYRSLDNGPRVFIINVDPASTLRLTITNLLPGRIYTAYVSTVNAIASQIPDNQFASISASVQTVTTGGPITTTDPVVEVSTAAAVPSGVLDASHLAAAIVVPVIMVLIGIFTIALLLFIWAYHKHTAHVKTSKSQVQFQNKLNGHKSSFEDEISSPNLIKGFSVQSSFKHNLPLHLIIPSTSIKLDDTIGQGEFGVVYKAYLSAKNQATVVTDTVAIKTLKGFYDREAVRNLLKECSRMYTFNHPNILSLTGVCLDGGPAPYIIMPLMINGSLLAHLKKNRESLVISSESSSNENNQVDARIACKMLMDMCLQIARGMEYLAKMKMVHRDLAARNCMIDAHYVIKVADFGLAESVGTEEYFRQDKSTVVKLPLKWMAPESLQDYFFTEKSDVWAYGVTCWEIFTGGKVPYPSINVIDLPGLLVNGLHLQKPMNNACNDQTYTLMLQCWEFEAKNRPTFSGLVSSLSQYLEAMADYMDVSSTIIPNSNCVDEKTDGARLSLRQ